MIVGYEYRINGGSPINVGNVLSQLVAALNPGTTYNFELRSYDENGERSAWTSIVSAAAPLDDDVIAFLTATGITDENIGASLSRHAEALKTAGIWDKLDAIWVMVGGTAAAHKFNLKDPQDTDAAFRATFGDAGGGAGWVHSATGALPDGVGTYIDTHFNQQTHGTHDSESFGVYLRNDTAIGAGKGDMSCGLTAAGTGSMLYAKHTSGLTTRSQQTGAANNIANSDSRGFYAVSRINDAEYLKQKDGSVTTVTQASNQAPLDLNFLVSGRYNTNTSTFTHMSDREVAYAFIGGGLTEQELLDLYAAVETLQDDLGRSWDVVFSSDTITDAISEWWIYPQSMYVSANNRTYFGAVSATGQILACAFDHDTDTARRYLVGTAIADDHCTPSINVKSGRRPLIVWTRHGLTNNIYYRVGAGPDDIRNWETEGTIDMGGGASYTQVHYCETESSASEDVYYVFVRAGSWKLARLVVNHATGGVTSSIINATNFLHSSSHYLTSVSSGDVIRVAAGSNPAATEHDIYYFEIDLSDGSITAPGTSLAANLDGTNLPVGPGDVLKVVDVSGNDITRLFYVRNAPEAAAICYAKWDSTDLNTREYFHVEIADPMNPVSMGLSGVEVGYTPAVSYIGGMAYPDPPVADTVYLSREAAGTWTIEKWTKDGTWSGETLKSSGTPIWRPNSPVGGGPIQVLHNNTSLYNSYNDYASDIESIESSELADFTPLIDEVGTAAAGAYGLRKLRSAHSGSCLRVRRSSDNAEQDIGFVGEVLDWAAAIAFKGAGSLFVRTLYDQSGNSKDAGQTTAAAQPALDTDAGKIVFDGVDDYLVTGSNIGLSGDVNVTAFHVGAAAALGYFFFFGTTPTALSGFGVQRSSASTTLQLVFIGGNTYTATAADLGVRSLITTTKASGAIDANTSFRQNGGLLSVSGTPPSTTPNITDAPLYIGTIASFSSFFQGSMEELVIFPSVLGSTPRAAGEANINAYHTVY